MVIVMTQVVGILIMSTNTVHARRKAAKNDAVYFDYLAVSAFRIFWPFLHLTK